jgi:release factor glutamine methyltransferase
MKLKEIKAIFRKELQPLYPPEEVDSFFYQLLEHYQKANRFVLVIDPERSISSEEESPFFEALSKLKKEYPIQYIIGHVHFLELELKVSDQVLIPRPETEELVRWILEENNKTDPGLRVLDVGTGSGCIALAIASAWPEARVFAMDVSQGALDIARENASSNKLQVYFCQGDICSPDPPELPWDIIVSNPPYVRESEKEAMQNNVRVYEPATALYVPDDTPLHYYRCLASYAAENLIDEGLLYLEINQYLGPETCRLLKDLNLTEIELRKDMYGNDRMVKAMVRRE